MAVRRNNWLQCFFHFLYADHLSQGFNAIFFLFYRTLLLYTFAYPVDVKKAIHLSITSWIASKIWNMVYLGSTQSFVHANVWTFSPSGSAAALMQAFSPLGVKQQIRDTVKCDVTLQRWRMHFKPHMYWGQHERGWVKSCWEKFETSSNALNGHCFKNRVIVAYTLEFGKNGHNKCIFGLLIGST